MSFSLGSFVPSTYLAPAKPLVLHSVDQWFEYIRYINNSPYQLTVDFGGTNITISEFWAKDVPLPRSFQGTLIITPSTNITSGGHAQSNSLTLEGYYRGEISNPTDQAIPQQAVSATASGQPVFSTSVGWNPTTTTQQNLNLFNPANSNVLMELHSARVFTNDSTTPLAVLAVVNGADLNLASSAGVTSHFATGNPPASQAHCTSLDGTHSTGPTVEDMFMQQNVTQDFLTFPDYIKVYPGNNLLINLNSGTSGHIVRMTMKWTEYTIA